MKYIRMLTAALLVASTTQAFAAADALADPSALATRLMAAGVRNPELITNETLLSNGFRRTLGLARVRAAFVAGATTIGRSAELTVAPTVTAPAPVAALDLRDGSVDIHGTPLADHAAVVAGLKAKTHAVVNMSEHNLTAPILLGLKAGTHVVADEASIRAEAAAKAQATSDLAALTKSNTTLRTAAAATYKLVPAHLRPKILREAYTGISDADALVTVTAVANLTGGDITPMDNGLPSRTGVSAPLTPVNAATFLAALNETGPIADFSALETITALHTAHDAANKPEIDALETLALAYADFG